MLHFGKLELTFESHRHWAETPLLPEAMITDSSMPLLISLQTLIRVYDNSTTILLCFLYAIVNASKNMLKPLVLVTTFTVSSFGLSQTDERIAILETVQKFFDSIETRDQDLLESILVPESLNISARHIEGNEVSLNIMSYADMVTALTRPGRKAIERSWDETVLIQGNIAVVWTPYDFHIDGDFSHCGIDSFQLIKRESRWLISNSSWTLETENCPQSPLGPIDQ